MLRTLPAALALALLLGFVGPSASQGGAEDTGYTGGPVPVVLYGHIYDLLEAVPMTTHPMHPDAPDLARGYSQPTVAPHYGAGFNRVHLFNSMGPVEYNASLAQPRIHPERGLALDLLLDQDQDILVSWYMSADALEVQQAGFEPPVHAGALPQLRVRAELRLGNDIRDDLRAGELVAAGETVVDLVSAPGAEVMEVAVNLGKAQLDAIPRRESFNLGITWYQLDENGNQVLMPGWNVHTGAAYPNRLTLPVRNPINLYFVEPQFQDEGKLAVNAAFLSPLGNYDVDSASLTIDIVGPGGFRPKTISEPVLVQHTYQHNDHNVAALNGWLWDYAADGAPPGDYEVTVTGTNLQGTATASKKARFTIEEQGEAGTTVDSDGVEVVTTEQLAEQQAEPPRRSPGFEAAFVAAAVGAALLARRKAS